MSREIRMLHTCALSLLLLVALPVATAVAAVTNAPATQPAERFHWTTFDSGVRLCVVWPGTIDPTKPTLLVLYATPNGSTIEQTLGCASAPRLDWRYDIQHVAAQIRRLRQVDREHNIVLAVTQAPGLSWPAFRQAHSDAGQIIQAVVNQASVLPGKPPQIVLTGHSGGGSFIFGYLNAHDVIPPAIARIAFLDANYSYDDATHGPKLHDWLTADASHHLVVIAYDDREITLNGKKVVGPTGGTFRATERMTQRFKNEKDWSQRIEEPFIHSTALGGQLHFFVHKNPQNKILHTALVGEMNGLLQALTLGTRDQGAWGTFGGPRAYVECISPTPILPPATSTTQPTTRPTLPPRPADAPSGSAFFKQIESLSPREREAAILKEIGRGNVPPFLRNFVPIHVQIAQHKATYFVMPDYLSVGDDNDFFRLPMTPMTARALADAFNCTLITRKISDDVSRQAPLRLTPLPLTENRESPQTFYLHHQLIEAQRLRAAKPLGTLIAGIKKDVVQSNRLLEQPHRVAIYGWHRSDGHPIQPLSIVHADSYVDYSHGVRLMSRLVIVDDRPTTIDQVLKDPALWPLVSDEGAFKKPENSGDF
jgi:hypothetical protein